MGGETQKQQITAEAKQAIEAYRESANKNPELHMANLLRQGVGYMKNKNAYYLERKQTYDDAMALHEKDPKVKPPLLDPFVGNYEKADKSIRKLIDGTGTTIEELVKMDEGGIKKLAEAILKRDTSNDVKKLANATWVRTMMPQRQMVQNGVEKETGALKMAFGRLPGEGADSFLTVWPSGSVKVIVNGKEQPTILPPFPGIFFNFT